MMQKYEYKVVKVPMQGIFKRDIDPSLNSTLNSEGNDGWQLINSITQASGFGESDQAVLIFMREKA
jgi:hypothetical protein